MPGSITREPENSYKQCQNTIFSFALYYFVLLVKLVLRCPLSKHTQLSHTLTLFNFLQKNIFSKYLKVKMKIEQHPIPPKTDIKM